MLCWVGRCLNCTCHNIHITPVANVARWLICSTGNSGTLSGAGQGIISALIQPTTNTSTRGHEATGLFCVCLQHSRVSPGRWHSFAIHIRYHPCGYLVWKISICAFSGRKPIQSPSLTIYQSDINHILTIYQTFSSNGNELLPAAGWVGLAQRPDFIQALGFGRSGAWGLLGTSGDIWGHLGTSGDIWGHLGTGGEKLGNSNSTLLLVKLFSSRFYRWLWMLGLGCRWFTFQETVLNERFWPYSGIGILVGLAHDSPWMVMVFHVVLWEAVLAAAPNGGLPVEQHSNPR